MFSHQGVEDLIPELEELEKSIDEITKRRPRMLLPHATRPFAQSFDLGKILGNGSFAEVWACVDKASRAELACKTVTKSSLTNNEKWDNLQREVVVLSALSGKSRGISSLVEVLETEKAVHLVMEICRGGDLYELLSTKGRLPESGARLVLKQIASALGLCHSMGIMHRDIKPENILFDSAAHALYDMTSADDVIAPPAVQAKLADFGLSVALRPGEKAKGTVGSRWYTAPELVQGKSYGRRVDVWSLGVVLCTMLSGKLPFAGKTHSDDDGLRRSILRGKVNFKQPSWEGVSEEAKEVVTKMLQVEPSKWITVFELLRHPWVSSVGDIPVDSAVSSVRTATYSAS